MHHQRGVKDFLQDLNQLERDEDLTAGMLSRHVTNWDEGRLSVMASPMDPADLDALGEADYRRLLRALYRFYDVLLLDTGTGLRDPWTSAILGEIADQVVVVAQASRDGAALADHTLDYLVSLRGAEWVAERVVVVINQVAPGGILDPGELQRVLRDAWEAVAGGALRPAPGRGRADGLVGDGRGDQGRLPRAGGGSRQRVRR